MTCRLGAARRAAGPLAAGLLAAGLAAAGLAGCSASPPADAPATSGPAPTGTATTIAASPTSAPPAGASPTGAPTIAEPTTTNTLPPPPPPTGPEPSTSGSLTARSLPVPKGWRTVVREGGAEEGFEGNGTWTLARDPRYAAQETITIGCTGVTRDEYRDPLAALEGTYESPKGQPGVSLALQFRSSADAAAYYRLYRHQLEACDDPDAVLATVVPRPAGLIDRRRYPDGEWTEVGLQVGARVTLVILADPGHRISTMAAEELLAQVRRTSTR